MHIEIQSHKPPAIHLTNPDTLDQCPDQTDVNQQLNRPDQPLKCASFSHLLALLFCLDHNNWSIQATVMSAVIDLSPACCRPLGCGGVALATVAFWLIPFGTAESNWLRLLHLGNWDYTFQYYPIEWYWHTSGFIFLSQCDLVSWLTSFFDCWSVLWSKSRCS